MLNSTVENKQKLRTAMDLSISDIALTVVMFVSVTRSVVGLVSDVIQTVVRFAPSVVDVISFEVVICVVLAVDSFMVLDDV